MQMHPGMHEFAMTMRDTNQRHYQQLKRWDPWSEDVFSFDNGELDINLAHSYAQENRSNRLLTQLRIQDKDVTRFEAKVKVLGGTFADADPDASYDVDARTRIELVFQPERYFIEDLPQGWISVSPFQFDVDKDGSRSVRGRYLVS